MSLQKLKCYSAGSLNPGGVHSVVAVCLATSHREARKLLWAGSDDLREECDWKFIDMQVGRCKEHDGLVLTIDRQEPHVIHDTAITRRMGWWCEGDKHCAACGLAEMDGDYPVCEHCERCAECRHAEGCEPKVNP